MKATPFVVTAGLALSGCAAGYIYDYDPYLGPRGRYVGTLEEAPPRLWRDCRPVFVGPHDGGWRGPYVSGPYCVPVRHPGAPGAPGAGSVAEWD